MCFVRAVVRAFVFLLIFGLGGGAALLDGCLVSCQSKPAASARTGHCHTAPTSASGAHVQEIARCCHDSKSGQVETRDSQLKLVSGSLIALTDRSVVADSLLAAQSVVDRHAHPFSILDSRQTPLRL